MARAVDESKMENIKKAVMSLVVEKGYANASTSMIAIRSGVSEGYLYRYYNKKYDLVYDVLQEHIYLIVDSLNRLIESEDSFDKIIEKAVLTSFLTARVYPDKIKFLYVLMHDYSFEQSLDLREAIHESCSKVLEVGKMNRMLRDDITVEEIFQMTILYPIEFINLRMKNFFKRNDITDDDIKKVTNFVLNSIR